MLAYSKVQIKFQVVVAAVWLCFILVLFRSFFFLWVCGKPGNKQFSSSHHFASFIIFTRTKSCVSQFTNGSRSYPAALSLSCSHFISSPAVASIQMKKIVKFLTSKYLHSIEKFIFSSVLRWKMIIQIFSIDFIRIDFSPPVKYKHGNNKFRVNVYFWRHSVCTEYGNWQAMAFMERKRRIESMCGAKKREREIWKEWVKCVIFEKKNWNSE